MNDPKSIEMTRNRVNKIIIQISNMLKTKTNESIRKLRNRNVLNSKLKNVNTADEK